jgi:hypothetical protein
MKEHETQTDSIRRSKGFEIQRGFKVRNRIKEAETGDGSNPSSTV